MPSVLETVGPRSGSAPLTYTLTELGTVDVQSIFAAFNGAAAGGSFRPCITVRSQSGAILARSFPTDSVTAGDSADVTFAPFLRNAGGGSSQLSVTDGITTVDPTTTLDIGSGMTLVDSGGGVALIAATGGGSGTELNYTEQPSTVNITASTAATANTIVTASAALTLDGATRIAVTFYCHSWNVGGASGMAADLWQGSTDLGIMAYAAQSNTTLPIMVTRYFTPAAGTYTYSIRGWKSNNDGQAQSNSGGPGTPFPTYIRIATA